MQSQERAKGDQRRKIRVLVMGGLGGACTEAALPFFALEERELPLKNVEKPPTDRSTP
jgi:hypothetical protein